MIKEEEEFKEVQKGKWYKTKVNWGLWVLVGGFVAWLIVWFIVRPMVLGG